MYKKIVLIAVSLFNISLLSMNLNFDSVDLANNAIKPSYEVSYDKSTLDNAVILYTSDRKNILIRNHLLPYIKTLKNLRDQGNPVPLLDATKIEKDITLQTMTILLSTLDQFVNAYGFFQHEQGTAAPWLKMLDGECQNKKNFITSIVKQQLSDSRQEKELNSQEKVRLFQAARFLDMPIEITEILACIIKDEFYKYSNSPEWDPKSTVTFPLTRDDINYMRSIRSASTNASQMSNPECTNDTIKTSLLSDELLLLPQQPCIQLQINNINSNNIINDKIRPKKRAKK